MKIKVLLANFSKLLIDVKFLIMSKKVEQRIPIKKGCL